MGSIWTSGSGFRLNHSYSRMLHLDWKPESGDSPPVPLSLKLTYEKGGSFTVEVREDLHSPELICYFFISLPFKLILFTGDKFIQQLLGWAGVGLTSYLLLDFWYSKLQATEQLYKLCLSIE